MENSVMDEHQRQTLFVVLFTESCPKTGHDDDEDNWFITSEVYSRYGIIANYELCFDILILFNGLGCLVVYNSFLFPFLYK